MKSSTSFDFNAGRLVLNFINTVEERPGYHSKDPSPPLELLNSPERLLAWCEASGAVSREVLARARSVWHQNSMVATHFLTRLISLRERLFSLFWELIQKGSIQDRSIAFLNAELSKLPPRHIAKGANGTLLFTWLDDENAEELLLAAILSDTVKLLTSDLLPRVRVCSAVDCGWLFLDTSKNGRRRWCDMSDCGNREKQRRFQMRALVSATL